MVRARESHRDDRLFDDPYAQAFVDAAPGAFPEEPKTGEELAALGPMASLGAVFYVHGVIRTRFFDDYLTAATAGGRKHGYALVRNLRPIIATRLAADADGHLEGRSVCTYRSARSDNVSSCGCRLADEGEDYDLLVHTVDSCPKCISVCALNG
jgi:hypothetical protein